MSEKFEDVIANCEAGDFIECISDGGYHWYTDGKSYRVYVDNANDLYIIADDGGHTYSSAARWRLASTAPAVPCSPAPPPTVSQAWLSLQGALTKCTKGDNVKCVENGAGASAWTVGVVYLVNSDRNGLYVYDNQGDKRYSAGTMICFEVVHTNVPAAFAAQYCQEPAPSPHDDSVDADSFGIGKPNEPKQWQPDVLDVDMSKKISDW